MSPEVKEALGGSTSEGGGTRLAMVIEGRPAREYADVRTMVGPKDLASNVCWCLSYRRITTEIDRTRKGPARARYVESLCRQDPPPGVLAYEDETVAGWAAATPRTARPTRSQAGSCNC